MRLLEARFHPQTRSGRRFVIVGRVWCNQSGVSIEPLAIRPELVKPFDSDRLHEKLEFLVTSLVGDRARALLEMQSVFWSFIELPTRETTPSPPAVRP